MILDAPLRKRERSLEFRHTDPGGRRAVKDDVFKAATLGEQLVEPHPVMRQIAVIKDRDLIRLRRHRPLLGHLVWGAGRPSRQPVAGPAATAPSPSRNTP